MFFHSGLSTFSGGYVGVDIFFVISGYLITSIILEKKRNNNFSLIDFYLRRVRRILPALIFVCLSIIPFAYFFMPPEMFKEFGKQLIAVQIFISNFYFWNEINYFSTSVDLNPLIHSWSLAVEEQFYLFFPILIIAAYRYGISFIFKVILIIAIASLLFAQFSGNLMYSFPFFQSDFKVYSSSSLSSFYLPFARAWELLSGSLVAIYLFNNNVSKKSVLNDFLCALGFILILTSIHKYSPETPFPSFYTIIPVAGTIILIIFTSTDSLFQRIFSNIILVRIGLVSFSAYLWHQPVFAFTRLNTSEELSFVFITFGIFISFCLAFLTWKYIEQPFRNIKIISNKALVFTIASLSAIIIIIGFVIYTNDGFSKRFSEKETILLNPPKNTEVCQLTNYKEELYRDIYYCNFGNLSNFDKTIIIYGDSHAKVLFKEIEKFFINKNIKGVFIENQNCKRFFVIQCIESNNYIKDLMNNVKPDKILLNFRWAMRIFDGADINTSDIFEDFYIYNYESLTQKQINKKNYLLEFFKTFERNDLLLVYPTPEFIDPKIVNLKNISNGIAVENIFSDETEFFRKNQFMIDIFNEASIPQNRVFVHEIFCSSFIDAKCVAQFNEIPYFADTNHVSDYGAELIVDQISKKIN